jgi:hypothetical protein
MPMRNNRRHVPALKTTPHHEVGAGKPLRLIWRYRPSAFTRRARKTGVSPALPHFSRPDAIEDVDKRVAKGYPDHSAELPAELRMPVDQLLVTLDHWINVIGEDHVALGSDFDGGPDPPPRHARHRRLSAGTRGHGETRLVRNAHP